MEKEENMDAIMSQAGGSELPSVASSLVDTDAADISVLISP
jgi:hypothetical protein